MLNTDGSQHLSNQRSYLRKKFLAWVKSAERPTKNIQNMQEAQICACASQQILKRCKVLPLPSFYMPRTTLISLSYNEVIAFCLFKSIFTNIFILCIIAGGEDAHQLKKKPPKNR